MAIEDEEKLVEELRKKLGGSEKKIDARSELERLFGKKEEAQETKLRKKLHKKTLQEGDQFNLHIERIAFGGDALGRHKNISIFVPEGIPGDTLKVQITDVKDNFCRAKALDIIAPSSDQIQPKCPHFNQCGGCRLQNLVYTAQLAAKTVMIKDILRNIAGCKVPIQNPIPSPETYGYRLRAKLKIQEKNSTCLLGFSASKSNKFVAIDECPILAPLLNRIIKILPELLPRPGTAPLPSQILLQCDSEARHAVICLISDDKLYYAADLKKDMLKRDIPIQGIITKSKIDTEYTDTQTVTHVIGSNTFQVPGNSFFQANRFLLKKLQEQAILLASPSASDRLLDLYCGTGFFSIPMARFAESSIGLDVDSQAIEFANKNADNNKVSDTHFIHSDDSEFFKVESVKNSDFSLIIADPPRGGMNSSVLDGIIKHKPGKFLYISCNPPHLARDIPKLLESDFRLRLIQLIDLFPHTHQIEAMAFFTHKYRGVQAASVSMPDLR